jgi:putative ABC transport system permease protein
MAVRRALGASGRQIVRQLVAESILLAAAGGATGLLLAWWAQAALLALSPSDLPRIDQARIDLVVLGFTATLSIVTGMLFGLVPSLHSAHDSLTADLNDGGTRSSAAPRSTRSREALVTLQLSVALVLVVGATLLLRSFAALERVDTGINTHNLLTFSVFLTGDRVQSQIKQAAFYDEMLARIRALPDVTAAGAAVTLPIGGDDFSSSYLVDGHESLPGDEPSAGYQTVTPGYFGAMGIPLLSGRDFDSRDARDGAPVVLVNKTLAAREWPGANPVGRRMRTRRDEPWMTVVGVVGDVRHGGPSVLPRPEFYQPVAQRSFPFMAFVVRTRHDPAPIVSAVRSEVAALDSSQPISDVAKMDEHLARALSRPRFMSSLIAVFGMLALALSIVGVYGVMAYAVTQRTREISIRMALGARPRTIVTMVLSRTMRLVVIGLGAGITGAVVFARALSGFLFGLQPFDPTTFVLSSVLLAAAALAAGAIPAFRATRIEAVDALRL